LADEIDRENQIHMEFYEQSGGSYRISKIKHFLIIDSKAGEFKKSGDKIFETYQRLNIYPIVYKEHIFLEKLFEELCRSMI